MLTFNLKTTFFTVKTSNEVYCCRIYFVNYIQNVHIINRTLHGSLEDMDFMFSWQEQYLTRSLRSLVRYCSCHSNIKSISSCNRVISYIYYLYKVSLVFLVFLEFSFLMVDFNYKQFKQKPYNHQAVQKFHFTFFDNTSADNTEQYN